MYYHIAATWNGTNFSLYINGKLNKSLTQTRIPFKNTGILRIGKNTIEEQTFIGVIDELAIYNITLPASIIAQHAGILPNETSARWNLADISDQRHIWNCLAYDNQTTVNSNFINSNITFTMDVQ